MSPPPFAPPGHVLNSVPSIKVPAIGFAIFWVATKHSTVMGENRLMRMIMLIELAMPSGAVSATSCGENLDQLSLAPVKW